MQITKRTSIIGTFFILLWSIPVISIFIYFPGRVSYVYWSNLIDLPFLAERLKQIDVSKYSINLLLALAGVLLFFLSCLSLGLFLTKISGLNKTFESTSPLSKLAQLATQFLLGHGTLSLIFLSLGGLYKLSPPNVFIILAIGIFAGFRQLNNAFQGIYPERKLESDKDKVILGFSFTIIFLALLLSSARISYDSSAIYFSDAKITALTGHIQFFANDTFVASVFHSAIQFSAIIQTFGDQSARMFSWVNGIAIMIFSLALGEKVGLSKSGRFILLALLVTSTAFTDLLGDGKVDLISSAPALAAIYWMSAKGQNKNSEKSIFLLTGFLMGLAIIGRPFNAFLLGIFCALFYFQKIFLVRGFNLTGIRDFVKTLFWISAGAIGLAIYHLFANWMIAGSPLAFLTSVSTINPASGPWDFDPKQMMALRVFYPFIATFRNTPQSLGNISPLALAFLPALFLGDVQKKMMVSKELASLVVIAVITIILWISSFFTVVEIRYVFFLWVIIFLPVAEIIASILQSNDYIFQNIVFGLLALLLGFIVFRTAFIAVDSYSPLDQHGNPQCSNFILCGYLKPINQQAAPGNRVLTLSAYRYYLRTDLFSCSTTHGEYQALQELSSKNTEDFWLEVYRQGYKYIAYEKEYTNRHLQFGIIPSPENTPPWIYLEPIYGKPGDPVVAYKINVSNPPIAAEQVCKQNEDNIWEIKKLPAQ